MKKWKKFGIFTIALSSAVLLAACGSNSEKETADGKTTIEFSHWGGSEGYTDIYKDRIDAFEKANPEIKVKVISVADDYDTKMQTMFAGNEAPDVVQVAENGQNFASKNLFEDLSEYISTNNIDVEGNWADTMTQYMYEKKPFALPDRGGPEILYYNKDMFDAAGVEYPTGEWTMEDYTTAMEKLTIKEGDKTVQYGASGLDWTPNWGAFIKANGGSIVENGKMVIDSPENLEILKWYNDIYQKGNVLTYQELEQVKNSNADSMFAQGKVAMLTTGFWNVKANTNLENFNFDITTMPAGKEKTTWPFGSALAISKTSKNKDAAFKFIEFMTGEEAQHMLGETLADCPANLKVLNSEQFTNREVNGKKIDLTVVGESTGRVKIDGAFEGPYYGEVTSECGTQVKEMLLGRLTPEEAIKKMQENGEKILARY